MLRSRLGYGVHDLKDQCKLAFSGTRVVIRITSSAIPKLVDHKTGYRTVPMVLQRQEQFHGVEELNIRKLLEN